MRKYLRAAVGWTAFAALSGCADPHFIHDPQIGFFDTKQIPYLLKSLRCELQTYIAANHRRHIIYNALMKYRHDYDTARSEYSYFEMDPSRFGGVALELKVQDTAGLQSGTAFDWKRAGTDPSRTHTWHIGPTFGDQSTYDALMSFAIPQDNYSLNVTERQKYADGGPVPGDIDSSFECYSAIPTSENLPFKSDHYMIAFNDNGLKLKSYGFRELEQNLDMIAANTGTTAAKFQRLRVNGNRPLAEWLQEISINASTTSLAEEPKQVPESMYGGQMTYTFTIQTSAGIDLKHAWTTVLWTAVAGEVAASIQHTGTLTIVLNGLESADTSGAKTGTAVRILDLSKLMKQQDGSYILDPAKAQKRYADLPEIVPRPKGVTKGPTLKFLMQPRPAHRNLTPDQPRGSLIYPIVPLSPLGQ